MPTDLDPRRAYRILGLAPDASQADVKAAYRDLVQVWHPDRFPADSRLRAKAERNLQRINAAYAVLKDLQPAVPAGPPLPKSRLRESMAVMLGLGDLRDSTVLDVPVRALRRSIVILGLDRRPERSRRIMLWVLLGLALVVAAAVVLVRRRG